MRRARILGATVAAMAFALLCLILSISVYPNNDGSMSWFVEHQNEMSQVIQDIEHNALALREAHVFTREGFTRRFHLPLGKRCLSYRGVLSIMDSPDEKDLHTGYLFGSGEVFFDEFHVGFLCYDGDPANVPSSFIRISEGWYVDSYIEGWSDWDAGQWKYP